MDVLMVNKKAPFTGRGAEQVIWKIAQAFADAGHRVTFFSPAPPEDAAIPDYDGVDFEFADVRGGSTKSQIAFFLKGPRSYPRVYRRVDPDLVYDNPSPFLFHLAHVYGDAPVVSKVHAIYRRLAFPCKDHPLVKVGTIAGEETYRFLSGEYFLTNSESTAERLRSLVNTRRNVVAANPIGIDADEFDFHFERDSRQVLSLSKLSPRKRIGDLLRAWQYVETDHPDATLHVAGSGPREDALRELADDLALSSVVFEGFVSEQRKYDLYRESLAYVLPTLLEGFGLANLEAMAAGCAVVSTDTWGVKDYLRDRENGLLVPPKSPRDLGAAISELLANPDLAERLAHEGRATAESYSMADSLDRELDFVEDEVLG